MALKRQIFILISLLALNAEASLAHPGNNASADAVCKKTKVVVASSVFGSSALVFESEKALRIQQRRNRIRTLPDGKLVRSNHRSNSKVLILGGAEAFPM